MPFLVTGEVAVVYLFRFPSFQVFYVFWRIISLQLQCTHNVVIFLFKDFSKLPLACAASLVVDTVIIHMVYEEERETLDAHLE